MNSYLKFEVPYNFDKSILPFYIEHSNCINYIFVVAYKDDCQNSNRGVQNSDEVCIMPENRREYEDHLRCVVKCGLPVCVLWQDREKILSFKLLSYYSHLGVNGFMIHNPNNAEIIKKFDANLLVISSITRHIYKGLKQMDFHNFDYIVLAHPFARALDCIKELKHLKEKLVLLVNTGCHAKCYSPAHWFNPEFNPRQCQARLNADKTCFIPPDQLHVFDNYVGGYKLLGRELPTYILKEQCECYFNRKYSKGTFIKWLEDAITEHQTYQSLEKYYNTLTNELIGDL